MNLYNIARWTSELKVWAEEMGDALSHPIAWKSAITQCEQPEEATSLPVGVYMRQRDLTNGKHLSSVPVKTHLSWMKNMIQIKSNFQFIFYNNNNNNKHQIRLSCVQSDVHVSWFSLRTFTRKINSPLFQGFLGNVVWLSRHEVTSRSGSGGPSSDHCHVCFFDTSMEAH